MSIRTPSQPSRLVFFSTDHIRCFPSMTRLLLKFNMTGYSLEGTSGQPTLDTRNFINCHPHINQFIKKDDSKTILEPSFVFERKRMVKKDVPHWLKFMPRF
jgi:hypothetical protein